jgi:hypothetical protein
MSYSGTMTLEWLSIIETKSQSIVSVVNEGFNVYKKWYDFSYGKSMADIGTALGITTQEATDLNAAFNALKEFNDAMNNVAVSAADRKTTLIKFY